MNIDNWPMDRIMRLPDWCFGRRYWVGAYQGGTNGVIHYNMAEEKLPDRFVIWGVVFNNRAAGMTESLRCTIRLGDRVPANIAEAQSFDRLFKSMSTLAIAYEFYIPPNDQKWLPAERQYCESKGMRLVIVTNGDAANSYECTVAIQISALPKEVPDWLISGLGQNL